MNNIFRSCPFWFYCSHLCSIGTSVVYVHKARWWQCGKREAKMSKKLTPTVCSWTRNANSFTSKLDLQNWGVLILPSIGVPNSYLVSIIVVVSFTVVCYTLLVSKNMWYLFVAIMNSSKIKLQMILGKQIKFVVFFENSFTEMVSMLFIVSCV